MAESISNLLVIILILAEGTLEKRIDRLLEGKRGMADQIIKAASDRGYKWTREELLWSC